MSTTKKNTFLLEDRRKQLSKGFKEYKFDKGALNTTTIEELNEKLKKQNNGNEIDINLTKEQVVKLVKQLLSFEKKQEQIKDGYNMYYNTTVINVDDMNREKMDSLYEKLKKQNNGNEISEDISTKNILKSVKQLIETEKEEYKKWLETQKKSSNIDNNQLE